MAISLLGTALDVCSQAEQQSVILMKSKVLDAHKLTPVPYVNVYLQRGHRGTSCNEHGEFSLQIDKAQGSDTLVFSAIGYDTYKKSANQLLDFPDAAILLEEATIDLHEVVVTAQAPVDIIRKAMLSRAVNYDTMPHKLRGVYRIADRENGVYTRLAEAAVDIYDADYMKKDSRVVDYLAVRHSKDYRTYRWKMDNLNSRTVEALLKPDLIKRPTRATHANGFEKGFFYAFEGYSVLDGKELLIISATRNPAYPWANYNATFYVRAEDLAIMRVDRDYSIPRPNWAKNEGMKTRITRDQLILQYKDFNGKLYLNHFTWNLEGDVVNEANGDKVIKFTRHEALSIDAISSDRPGKIRRAWSDDIYKMQEPYNALLWDAFPSPASGLFTEATQELNEKGKLWKK